MAREFEYDVFISFSSLDDELAQEIWQELSKYEINVFWSHTSLKEEAGDSWIDVIQSSLESSKHMILICTASSMKSVWVKREYKAFLSHCYKAGDRKLIPLLAAEFDESSLPLFLRELQSLVYKTPKSLSHINKILGLDIPKRKNLSNKETLQRNNKLSQEELINVNDSDRVITRKDKKNKKNKKALNQLSLIDSGDVISDLTGISKLQRINDLVDSLDGDCFIILERSDEYFMQAIESITGVPGEFHLEYREGSGEEHYKCSVSKKSLKEALRSFAVDDDSWRKIHNWEKVTNL